MSKIKQIFIPAIIVKAAFIPIFLVFFGAFSVAQEEKTKSAPAVQAQTLRDLQQDLDAFVNDPNFGNASVGVCVMSLKTGEFFYRLNENKNIVPASNMKLLTTAAALEYLGKDFTFSTTVYLDGVVKKGGEFVGNVIIRGAGDPSMSEYFFDNPSDILDKWAACFDSLGIRSIRGNIIGDDSYFDRTFWAAGWAWDDIPYSFSAQISALSIFDNKVDLWVSPAMHDGESAEISLEPDNSYLSINNSITTVRADSAEDISAFRDIHSNTANLVGVIPLDPTHRKKPALLSVTIDDPSLFFVHLFKQSLEKRGIRVRGGLFNSETWEDKINYTELRPLCSHTSPPLSAIVKIINTMSHNLCADALLKTLGKEVTGVGSFEKGAEVVKRFVAKHGISPDGISMVDGSGLSRMNFVTPKQIALLLASVYRTEYKWSYIESLSAPGQKGTLSNRMKNSRAEFNLRGKTGSMNNISALSGYTITRDDEPLAFSIILNNFTVPQSLARNLEDLLCMRLTSFSRK